MQENIFGNKGIAGNSLPNSSADTAGWGIDLNEQLVRNRPETFFLRVNSEAMKGAGINKGDIVIVDRSLAPQNGKIIIAVVGGDMLIRRLEINNGRKRLTAGPSGPGSLELDEHHFQCWGVVTFVIRSI